MEAGKIVGGRGGARTLRRGRGARGRGLRIGGLALAALLVGAPGGAALPDPAPAALPDATRALEAAAGCTPSDSHEAVAEAFREIATERDLEAARERALAPSRSARSALARARWMAPGSDALAEAEARLRRYERRVREAEDPRAVARELAGLTRLASADASLPLGPLGGAGAAAPAPPFEANPDCDYTGLEIVAIVIGFILGILPGIILLILLC